MSFRKYRPGTAPLPPIPVHAPPGAQERLHAAYDGMDKSGMRDQLAFAEVRDGAVVAVGPFRVTAFAGVEHPVPAFGYRVEADGRPWPIPVTPTVAYACSTSAVTPTSCSPIAPRRGSRCPARDPPDRAAGGSGRRRRGRPAADADPHAGVERPAGMPCQAAEVWARRRRTCGARGDIHAVSRAFAGSRPGRIAWRA